MSRGRKVDGVPPIAQAVASFQAGIDRERNFGRIVDGFYPPVERFFARKTPAEDARDLTQDTFLSLYRGLDGFRGEALFSTWVFRIARTTYHRWRQRQARESDRTGRASGSESAVAWEDQEPVVVDSERLPPDQVVRQEALTRLREAIETLPEKMRECLMLRLHHDLKYQEVADVMNISIQTVKAHLSQARQKLRGKLEPDFDGIDF